MSEHKAPVGTIEALGEDPEVIAAMNAKSQQEPEKPEKPELEKPVDSTAKPFEQKKGEEKPVEDPAKPVEEPKKKNFWDNDGPKSEEQKASEQQAEAAKKAELDEETKKKLARLELIEKNPLTKRIVERLENNLDIDEVIQSYKVVDPAKVSNAELEKMHFAKMESSMKAQLGLEGADLEKAIERAKDKFSELEPWEKAERYAAMRDEVAKNNERIKQELGADSTLDAVKGAKTMRQQNIEEAQREWGSMKPSIKGEDFHGVELTEERLAKVEAEMAKDSFRVVTKENGKIDVEASFIEAAKKALWNEVLQAKEAQIKGKVKEEIIDEYHRPSDFTTGKPALGAFRTALKSAEEKADEGLKNAGLI